MLKEFYLENIYKKIDLNCAESVLYTVNEVYNLKLSHEAICLSSPFGGGMYIEEKCGAVTGALMAFGCMFVNNNAHATDYLKEINLFFFNKFNEIMGSCECAPLKENHRSKTYGCRDVITASLDLLEETAENFSKYRVR